MEKTYHVLVPITELAPPESWSADVAAADGRAIQDVLSEVYFTDYELGSIHDGIQFGITIVVTREISFDIPGLQGMALVLGGASGAGITSFRLTAFIDKNGFELRADEIEIALRFPPSILKPVSKVASSPSPPYAEIVLTGTLSLDQNLDFRIEGFDRVSLPPVMIGNSGVVVSADDVLFDFSRTDTLPEVIAAGFDESFVGVFIGEARVKLPPGFPDLAPDTLILHNAAIGSGGVSGRLEAAYTFQYDSTHKTFTGDGAGELFGIPFGVGSVTLGFKQNAFQESRIAGQVVLPFFDKRVNIEIGINLDGSVAARITGVVEAGDLASVDSGLFTLKKDSILKLEVESIAFDVDGNGLTTKLSGKITPLIGGLDWPSFKVKELAIDSDGNVHLEGGWLDLRDQYSLDFHGFQMEITKLGFGKTEDGGKWIGFSGGLKLVDGFSAGASVEGLRVTWYDDGHTDISFNGVGVEFEVPEVLRFKGAVSYNGDSDEFSGDIKLDLMTLDMQVDGRLVFGSRGGQTYMAIYLAAELPAGIPLFGTGLALYGMAGLFALDMEPDKRSDQHWYAIEGGDWYHQGAPGVTDLTKWRPAADALALGAGVTVGTLSDNGYDFSGRVLLAIVFPGPVVLLEGGANLLQERSKLAGGHEPNFRALAVLDKQASTLLIGLDAQYKYNDKGKLIDIRGSAEAFFDFHDYDAWHLYLGEQEPREKRIRAKLFQLFEADTYFKLEPHQLSMGAWVGFEEDWHFGPLHAALEAWIEGNAAVSAKPNHFHGDLWLHGKAELEAFGFGTSLTVDARIAADVFEPFHVLGQFTVGIGLPWPLPDLEGDITLEWGPELNPPPLPLPLKEIAVEHFKVTTSWPLPRATLLLPNYDKDADGFLGKPEPAVALQEAKGPPPNTPIVPLDCRPHITFGRPVNDDALVGINPQPNQPAAQPPGWEWIGDPAVNAGPMRARYGLREIALHKFTPAGWVPVARKVGPDHPSQNPPGLPELFGSWAPVPQLPAGTRAPGTDAPVANTKLWLWSKTPFDYTRHSGSAWDEGFTEHFADYPCVPVPPDQETCCDFEDIGAGQEIISPWRCAALPQLELSWLWPDVQTVMVSDQPVKGLTHALCFPHQIPDTHLVNKITISLSESAKEVRIILKDKPEARAFGFDSRGNAYGPFDGGDSQPVIDVVGEDLVRVVTQVSTQACVFGICVVTGLNADEITRLQEMEQHLRDELVRWSQTGEILEPHTAYRLQVVTTIETKGSPPPPDEPDEPNYSTNPDFNVKKEQTEFAYFRTEGPPGLVGLSKPIGHPDSAEFDSGLDDLTRYVRQTIPATVSAVGQKPPLPRPVYRAYDVGVEFNEDYVDLMYRLERRDLGLYLYDNNNRPVRDAQGRLIVLSNRWGVTETFTLTESDERWITVVNASICAVVDTTVIPHDKTLAATQAGQVLDPDTVYEARLVPLLLHEDFAAYAAGASASGPSGILDRWKIVDEGTNDAPSRWEIREEGMPPGRHIVQTRNIWGGTLSAQDAVKPGTLLLRSDNPALPGTHPEQPGNWTDYRLSVYIRSADNGAIGVVFRYTDSRHYYRFSMDRERGYRRLVRVVQRVTTILAEDNFVYRRDQDYLITTEAMGSTLRIYQDGMLVFDVTDDSVSRGTIGLYSWGSIGVRFTDVRVDDFRQVAPVVYRFKFTTSQFANFFHHLHSFQDETWRVALAAGAPPDMDLATLIATAAAPGAALSDAENRAYETLAGLELGRAAQQNPPEVQMTRVERDGLALALLVQSPEPIDWRRTDLEVLRADRAMPAPEIPGAVKLTDVTFGTAQPNEESVTLLLREATDLDGHRIEYRRLPGPLAEPSGDPVLFLDMFEAGESGLLFQEAFGPNVLDHYTIVDEGMSLGPSSWAVAGGHIVQTSSVFGGSVSGTEPDMPGTLALTGSADWTDVRISATLRSQDEDAIGIVFRYQDGDNYYRFSMDRARSFRRLVKKVKGRFSVLWEDNQVYTLGHSYRLVINAFGGQLLGYLDDILAFSIGDSDFGSGRVGLYCWANAGATFESLAVEAREVAPILWQPVFEDLREVEIIDEPGAINGPSSWSVVGGVLTQSSDIQVPDDSPHRPGTYAVGGNPQWQDVGISVRLRSGDDDAIGVMFRYQDRDNYYRFSMDRRRRFRRLVKKAGGMVQVLWQDAVQYNVGQTYDLTLRAVDGELRGYLDGVLLFTVFDGTLKRGRVGFYCWANTDARFERVLVADLTRRVGEWTVHDEGTTGRPSAWRAGSGALVQTSPIQGGSVDGTDPAKPGTCVTAGSPDWADYRLVARMRSDDDEAIGVMFRYVDDDNYYRLSLDAQRSYRRLVKKEKGVITVLWEAATGYVVGEPFSLTIDAIGSKLVGYLNDVRLFEVHDSAHAAGKVGLYCWANPNARFERVEVRRPPPEAYTLLHDRFARGDTSGWSFVDEGTLDKPSKWSVFEGGLRQTSDIYSPPNDRDTLSKLGTQAIAGDPAWSDVIMSARLRSLDDDAIGLLFRYADAGHYYRFSMDRQRGYRRLIRNVGGVFTLLWEDTFAFEAGRVYELVVAAIGGMLRGYVDGIPVFVVEDGDLPAGRIGLYCWGNSDAQFSDVSVYPASQASNDWLLDETFAFLIDNRWTFVDEGDEQGPSQWGVNDGELRQISDVSGGSTSREVPDKPGTYALAGDVAWHDYRLSVRLRSDDDDAIGVMFRYVDGNNYYRFSMDRERGYRRLTKKVAGVTSVLWEDAGLYVLGREYVLTIDCTGERLAGYLDGVQLFALDDRDLAAGRIGLYCWANTGARFTEVRVAAPAWAPYYIFERGSKLPAGSRLRVFAGNRTDALSDEPGVIPHFVAQLDERGRLRLSEDGAQLQVRARGLTGGHNRGFLPADEYVSLDVRVLRKADGTGFFVLAPGAAPPGSELLAGQYRLKLAYRRDNRATEQNSQVFGQAGDSHPESTTLDIPW